MIVEKIVCDYPHCGTVADMNSGMVPDSWVRFNGKHYCVPMHFVLDIDVSPAMGDRIGWKVGGA